MQKSPPPMSPLATAFQMQGVMHLFTRGKRYV